MSEIGRALMIFIAASAVIIALVVNVSLSGCTTVPAAVNAYCATATEGERLALRERLNAQIDPHEIWVHCYDRAN